MTRNDAIKAIKTALAQRSGKTWSVKGGRGTGYGWITIDVPPKRKLGFGGHMGPVDQAELAKLLGLEAVGWSVLIPASNAYYEEYIARAEGRKPERYGEPYWD